MSFALIKDGIVLNVIEASPEFAATLDGYDAVIEADDVGIGWTWDGASFAPQPVPRQMPEIEPRYVTRLAFRNRFTAAEKVALEMASLDDPAAPMTQRQQAAMLRVNLEDVKTATFIDLDRQDTRTGVQAMEAAGLLAAGRAAEILDAPLRPEERYTGAPA